MENSDSDCEVVGMYTPSWSHNKTYEDNKKLIKKVKRREEEIQKIKNIYTRDFKKIKQDYEVKILQQETKITSNW